jgi:Parvulin-like peptidyl-prolyl isomerase
MPMSTTPGIRLLIVFCACAVLYTQTSQAVSIRELLGLGKPEEESRDTPRKPEPGDKQAETGKEPAAKDVEATKTEKPDTSISFKLEELQKFLELVDEKQRKSLLEDEENFRNFVKNEAANKSVYAAARANRVDQNEKNLLIAQRGAENILREIYLRQLLASKIPADFPSDEQIKDYYEKNRDKFVLPERLPVWQIFLSVPEDMAQKDIELLKKKAESIVTDINKNKIEFAAAAIKYSEHAASKFNGGFMGVIKVSDIKPEIQPPLLALSPEKVSQPVISEEGIHILKRGAVITKQELKLEEVREEIKKSLKKQADIELRKAIYQQASKSYPVNIDDKLIEEWRLKIRTSQIPVTVSE